MPEAFHARFSVSCRSYEVTSRVFGLQPTKLLIAREKKTSGTQVIFLMTLWMKPCGGTISATMTRQYFYMILFVSKFLKIILFYLQY